MNITKQHLNQIIQEEYERLLDEIAAVNEEGAPEEDALEEDWTETAKDVAHGIAAPFKAGAAALTGGGAKGVQRATRARGQGNLSGPEYAAEKERAGKRGLQKVAN